MAGAPGVEDETVEDHLYDGEHRVGECWIADARVVLTSHRLLVVRERGTPRFRAVDRPNLGEVQIRTESDRGHLLSAAQWTALGLGLLAAWRVVPFDALVRPIDPPPGTGFDGLFAAVNTLVSLFALLDDAFLALGLLALGWAVVGLGRYLHGRERRLEVAVSGEDPLRFPASDEAADRLRALLRDETPGEPRPDA